MKHLAPWSIGLNVLLVITLLFTVNKYDLLSSFSSNSHEQIDENHSHEEEGVVHGTIDSESQEILLKIPFKDAEIFQAETSDRSVGRVVEDSEAASEAAVKATVSKDGPGNLVYGNSIVFDKGVYKINFRLKIDSLDTTNEVVANLYMDGLTSLQPGYTREIYSSYFDEADTYQDFDFLFQVLEDNTEMVPWVFYTGQANVSLDNYEITEVGDGLDYSLKKRDAKVYEEEALGRKSGTDIADDEALNGKAVIAIEGIDSANHIAFGPYSRDQSPGVYKAIFRMKVGNNTTDEVVAKIDVFNAEGNGVNKNMIIRANDFDNNNTYEEFEIPYIRTARGAMEYRVYFYGVGTLALDNITVVGDFEALPETTKELIEVPSAEESGLEENIETEEVIIEENSEDTEEETVDENSEDTEL